MITTLTLSPAYDVHVNIDEFHIGRENLADSVFREVGGKGINISRALLGNGVESRPVVLVGNESAADFCRGLEKDGLACDIIECQGRIRENITVHTLKGTETRLSFKGFSCDAAVLEAVVKLIGDSDVVTFTGSLPMGISADDTEKFLLNLRESGKRVVIDSKSVTLDMLRRIRPWLIKPNEEEIRAYFGGEMTEKRLSEIAMELHRDGIENVMISLGGDGALLASDGKLFRARVPKITARSTIGAGDSTIAGFIAKEDTAENRLRRAVSFGTAACLRDGTKPPLPKDVERISEQVIIE